MDSFQLTLNFDSLRILINIMLTFAITCVAWIFFRSKTIQDAFAYISRMFTEGHFTEQYFKIERYTTELWSLLLIFVLVEWNSRTKIEPISGKYSWVKMSFCLSAILALGVFSDYKEFIYFQF
jgi:uncharacterized membrane protein